MCFDARSIRLLSWRAAVVAFCLVFLHAARAAVPAGVEDFTFVHLSDIHAPMAQSAATIAKIKGLGSIDMAPFSLRVPAPSFAVATGDLTEFGGGNGWWEEYLSYWKGCQFPVYNQLGNHDNTWHANINFLRAAGQKSPFSFDSHGCHFVGLMTPTPQDPRPSISEEQLAWLENDLEKAGLEKPVFAFFHHPLGGTEFASRYDWERLLDVLRRYNTVLLMAGHSHGFVYRPIGGLDQVTDGSTFGANAGFSVISVKDGMIRGAYWKAVEAAPSTRLFEKAIPLKASYPQIEISSPGLRDVCGSNLSVYVRLGTRPDGKTTYTVDDQISGDLAVSGGAPAFKAAGHADLSNLTPGAHYLRVEFASGGKACSRSTHFFYEPAKPLAAWRANLGASSKVAPVCAGGVVYSAANDGAVRAFDAGTGRLLWVSFTGAEILGAPLVGDGRVIAANGSGLVVACDLEGKRLWSFSAGDSVYSSPVKSGGNVVFGCNSGVLYALDAASGKVAWTNSDAGYAIESAPCVSGDRIFYGAWDQHIRCVESSTGKLIWKKATEGVRKVKAAQRYYSPGDAAPVVIGGKVLIADRNYMLTILDAGTGDLAGSMEKVAAVGASEDGKCAYLRRTDGRLTKIDGDGKEIWSAQAGLNAIPVAPAERDEKVYVCSGTGLMSAISAANGSVLWQYSVSPGLFVMSPVSCDGKRAYATAFDGSLTALTVER